MDWKSSPQNESLWTDATPVNPKGLLEKEFKYVADKDVYSISTCSSLKIRELKLNREMYKTSKQTINRNRREIEMLIFFQ